MDNKEEFKKELNRRNTAAVEQTLKDHEEKFSKIFTKTEGLYTTIFSLTQRINELEKIILTQKVALTGRGPSVKID